MWVYTRMLGTFCGIRLFPVCCLQMSSIPDLCLTGTIGFLLSVMRPWWSFHFLLYFGTRRWLMSEYFWLNGRQENRLHSRWKVSVLKDEWFHLNASNFCLESKQERDNQHNLSPPQTRRLLWKEKSRCQVYGVVLRRWPRWTLRMKSDGESFLWS